MDSQPRFIQRGVVGTESCAAYETPVGVIHIVSDAEAITAVLYRAPTLRKLRFEATVLTDSAARQLSEYFSGKRKRFDLPMKPAGTAFQKTVWENLLKIPYGEIWNYRDIAVAVKNVRGVRAVAQTVNRNPLAILVPCHRAIGCNGKLVHYVGGLQIQDDLLRLESSDVEERMKRMTAE